MNIKLSKIKKPFVIAELSANHNGNINNIYKLIDKAKKMEQVLLKFNHTHQTQ